MDIYSATVMVLGPILILFIGLMWHNRRTNEIANRIRREDTEDA